jgi:hypothetical protein
MKKSVIAVFLVVVAGCLIFKMGSYNNSSKKLESRANSTRSDSNQKSNRLAGNPSKGSVKEGQDEKSDTIQSSDNTSNNASYFSDNMGADARNESSNSGSNNDQNTSKKSNYVSQSTGSNQVLSQPQGSWVKTFEDSLYNQYGQVPYKYVSIGNGDWEVWVQNYKNSEEPYVTVNENTGHYHG